MHPSEMFSQAAKRNYRVIRMQTEGLTNEDSLIQPPVQGNCLNWVLGHIIYHRGLILKLLGDSPNWPEEQLLRYQRESEPVLGSSEDVLTLTQLLSLLDQSQEQITAALQNTSTEALETVVNKRTIEEQLAGLQWHETYHMGQLELLRQLTGKNDKVI